MTTPAEALRQLYFGYMRAVEGASDFLRDDLPSASPGVSRWVQGVGRRACRKYARQRGGVPFLTSDPTWDGICSGYWDSINEGPEEDGSYAPPFTGGQCANVRYDVNWKAISATRVRNTGETVTDLFPPSTTGIVVLANVYGPISVSNPILGRNVELDVYWTEVDGTRRYMRDIAYFQSPPNWTYTSVSGPQVIITPRNGATDNCGDPPPEYRPPRFPTNLPPLDPPTVPAPGLGDDWEVNILPDGQINICIGGECSIGTPPGGGGTPADPGGEPDGPPQETDPDDPDDPNEISGCVGDGNVLVGLKINVLEYPITYQGSGDIFYRVGWVWMGPNANQLDMTVDGGALRDGQFVFPDGPDCTCYAVRANPGFRLSVQAFSKPREENNNN